MKKIRAEFPRAVADLNGRKRAFFDNGTGTLVVGRAARAEAEARVNCSANVDAVFDESKKANAVILEGRKAAADLLNAPSPDTFVSGESATALLFGLSYAIGKELTGKENVVTTEYEHYANISPWMELERRRKIQKVRFARLNKDEGTLDMEHLQSLIDAKTKVVTVTAASNVLGTKSPLGEIGKMAKEVDAYFVVDAVHHVAHGPIDVKAFDCDFLVFSGYKLFTSHGSFLYGKQDLLESLKPYKVASAPDYAPKNWEWGTRDQSMFAAIRGVVDHFVWLADQVQKHYEGRFTQYAGRKRSLKVAMDAIEKYEMELTKAVLAGFDDIKGLRDMPRVKVYGLTDLNRLKERDPTFAFKVENMSDDEVVDRLWADGDIATRSEDFYSRALESYNRKAMIRISLVHYNTLEEIGVFLKTLNDICESR
ncbi:aminotransferase class V-fold PLP-dependent enzyme [Candidatus Bathyarchaeota archaeon]|nr:aminotransferase class V-fold PLP-dependent enzyme [Candidatus Bathyarchaeota archaeon]